MEFDSPTKRSALMLSVFVEQNDFMKSHFLFF